MAADPRTHITPDAFGVAPELLGFALAAPTRRLAAIAIDLVLAALIARTGPEFLVAAAAALFAWRALGGPAERLLAGRGRVVFRAASAILAISIVINVWNEAADRVRRLEPEAGGSPPGAGTGAGDEVGPDVELALQDLGLSAGEQASFLVRYATLQMTDSQTARTRGAELGRWVREKTSPDRREEFGAALATTLNEAARNGFLRELGLPDSAAVPADSAARSDAPADSVRSAAADSLRLLAAANRQLRDRNQTLSEALRTAKAEDKGGLRNWLGGISNDLGLGFGWFALYFTAFTVLGRGQTPGKRLLGIKVLRCDNRPIGWWLAFERFGAYAASASTGLLGFAQILWDRNRQALHDKAADTVVVRLRKGQPFRIA